MKPQEGENIIQKYIQEHKRRKRWRIRTLILAAAAAAAAAVIMILPAMTMENHPEMLQCQLDLHTHTDSCFDGEGNILCGYEDFVVHTHDDSCYGKDKELICPLEEVEEHRHEASCYQEVRVQTCGLEEGEAHVHGESCYSLSDEPVCGLEESSPHVHSGHIHTDACYETENVLICGLEETEPHTHGSDCYDEEGRLICGETEEGHTHMAECYESRKHLICTQDTGCYNADGTLACTKTQEGHTHTAECYERELTCTKEETDTHTHTDSCYETQEELICGKEEVILHTHTPECYDQDGALICGMREVREHIHDESCMPEGQENNPQYSALSANSAASPRTDAPAGSVDFGQYLTGFTLETVQDGQWVPVEDATVSSGDSIRLALTYTIPSNLVDESSRNIHYQLPSGIELSGAAQGPVLNGNTQVGEYYISEDGLITISLDEDFAKGGETFAGEVEFQGTVTATGSGEDDQINFGFDGGIITVVPAEKVTDLTVRKTGWYESQNQGIGYIVTVSSEQGTDGPVNIRDIFQTSAVDYDMDYTGFPFTVTWHGSDGETTTAVYPNVHPEVTPAQDGTGASFTLTGLPALGPGEYYEISYAAFPDLSTAAANGELVVTNTVTAWDDSKEAQASSDVTVSPARIDKTGEYDENTRKITWTVSLFNYDGEPIELDDELAWYDAEGRRHTVDLESVTADIEVIHSDGSVDTYTDIRLTFPYVIGSGLMGKGDYCIIVYQTELPEEAQPGSVIRVENTAYNNEYVSGADVDAEVPGEYNLIKTNTGDVPNDLNTLNWHSQIEYPDSINHADNLSYIDILTDLLQYDGSAIEDSHYTMVNSLAESLSVSCGGTPLIYGEDYYVYVITLEDLKGGMAEAGMEGYQGYQYLYETVSFDNFLYTMAGEWQRVSGDDPVIEAGYTEQVADPEARLGAFLIRFNNTQELYEKLSAQDFAPIDIRYQTHADASKLGSLSGRILAGNIGKIPNDSAIAWVGASMQETLSKQVSSVGPVVNGDGTADTSSYTSEQIHINTGQTQGLIYYRILLSGFSQNTVTLVDTLPAGMQIVDGTVFLAEHAMDSGQTGAWVSESENPYMIRHSEEQLSDGRTRVTFVVSLAGNAQLQGIPLGIYYTVSVENDTELAGEGTKNYENIVEWDGLTDSAGASVTHTESVLKKSGIQVTDENGNVTDHLSYSIIVNPQALDLDTESEQLILKDEMTVPDGADIQFRPETVSVYYYDPDNETGGFRGDEMPSSRYQVEYDPDTHVITFTLPDQLACVVVYEYRLDRGSAYGDINIYNRASLNGQAGGSAGSSITIEEEQSQATVNKATLTIFKYGGNSEADLLQDVLFELSRYEQIDGGYDWYRTSITAAGRDGYFITGGDGVEGAIIFNFLDDTQDGKSHYNTLYRLVEHETLPGYELDETPRYYVWMEQNASRESTIAAMSHVWEQTGVDPDNVRFIGFSENVTEYIGNEPATTSISAAKQWRDQDGAALTENIPESVAVTLYQIVDGRKVEYRAEGVMNPVILNQDNNWYYCWEGLPKETDGQPAVYTVTEEPAEGWETGYIYPDGGNGDAGIAGGTVTIVNTRVSGYVLPETGGHGTLWVTAAGLLLAGGSGAGHLYLRRRHRKRRMNSE